MRKLITTILALGLLALVGAAPARAEFGLSNFDVAFTNEDGSTASQAGAHPYAMTTSFEVNSTGTGEGGVVLDEQPKDALFTQISGLIGNATAVPQCTNAQFLEGVTDSGNLTAEPACPNATAVGMIRAEVANRLTVAPFWAPVFNLVPPPGAPAKLGFWVAGTAKVPVEVGISEEWPNPIVAAARRISQVLEVSGVKLTIWGVPGDSSHDPLRGHCLYEGDDPQSTSGEPDSLGTCEADIGETPFLTLPRSCGGPLQTSWEAFSWQQPTKAVFGSALTHDEGGNPQGYSGCGKLNFSPTISAAPTSEAASSPTGLDFSLDVKDEGLTNPEGIANANIEKAVIELPEGMSANPSLAEGLEVCSEADLERETAFSAPGAGCPNASKIGTVEVETPLVDETVKGSLFIAEPYENPFDSLLAMYVVLQNANLGIKVVQPVRIEPDPVTGQLVSVAEDLPELPFSHFKLHFREGTRSPLTTPQACGSYDATATLYPTSGEAPVTTTSTFQIITGPNEAPCPKGGLPPFKPGLIAGTLNNRAGSFSQFNLRMSRNDSEQEITRFSIKLPPGITGKLAGIPYCPDAAIEAAKARTGPHGGQEELDNPSCPAASEIGRTLAGAGVGPSLAYAPGKVYLAGPYNGSNLSMVAITSGVVGPFDIGTVVIRQAFKIDPETAEVFVDSTGSDPIPHIIRGIPVHLRDIRAYVDRPDFVLNPTDCTRTSTASTVLGSGLDFVSESDDNPFTATSPFQAADCAALPFEPQLGIRLIGGTKRGSFPAFKAHLQMNGIGESGIAQAQVTLPKSAFVEQSHFVTICTRVQFKEGAGNGANCPPGSIYGKARAITPLLSEPLEGPVFLRANGGERDLPDLVVALRNSQLDFNLIGHVDSVDGKLRNTFAASPDAPVTSFDLEMAGGKKGLFVNSRNLCAKKYRALAGFTGQNGKSFTAKPVLKVKCRKKAKGKGKSKRQGKRATRHSRAASQG